MLTFVLNRHGKPLMPCKPYKAKRLLKENAAKVVSRTPFVIKLKYGSSGYKQELIAGMDTGSKTIGSAVVDENGNVVFQSETHLRGEEIKSKMKQRAVYRRTRRSRKTRYRKPRFLNRRASKRMERLAPSIRHKVKAHFKEKNYIESILPISKWRLELASFDIHAISNPKVYKKAWWSYQRGVMYGFQNLKQYVLNRDCYLCQICRKKSKQSTKLHVHHIVFKSNGGTDIKDNLITLCEHCHNKLHCTKDAQAKSLKLRIKQTNTKHATEINIVASFIRKYFGDFDETFGFITKTNRIKLGLYKKHYIDASVIASSGEPIKLLERVLIRRYIAKGDYQQTKGSHSQKTIPTGKLFGIRKFDLISTTKGTGYVKGKRSTGYFSICDINWKPIHNAVKVKTNVKRISARSTVLTGWLNV